MQNLGPQFLTGVLLPGSVVFAASWLLLDSLAPTSLAYSWLIELVARDISFGLVTLVGSSLFGEILSSLMGHFENRFFDPKAAKNLEISEKLYREEWYCYVDGLSKNEKGNSYLSQQASLFYFEIRTAAAFLLLTCAVLVKFDWSLMVLGPFLLFCVLSYLAYETHYLLADWRDRLFRKQAAAVSMDRRNTLG